MSHAVILEATELTKTYAGGGAGVTALQGVDVAIGAGEFVALMGPSGCGKSTLLHLCGAMDRPSKGSVVFEGRRLGDMDDRQLTNVRRERIGFVFQFFNLLPTLTVLENVALPLLLGGKSGTEVMARATRLADRVGLASRVGHYPQQLSGGEMQRAAIARAVVHGPALLIADEPTGNLDSENGQRVMDLLLELNREEGVAVLLATHAPEVGRLAHRTVYMRDGRIEWEERHASPSEVGLEADSR